MSNPQDYFTRYLKYAGAGEVSPILHRWGAISTAGVLLSRRVYFRYGHSKIFPNFYIIFMGESASRKSTAVNQVQRVLETVGYDRFAPAETSKGKFAMYLAGIDPNMSPSEKRRKEALEALDVVAELKGVDRKQLISEAFICSGEFINFIGLSNFDFASFLGDIWDKDGSHEVSFKTAGEFKIYNPIVNILGGSNFEGLMRALPPEMMGQGFLSRCLFVYAPLATTKIAFPEVTEMEMSMQLLTDLSYFKTVEGEMKLSEAAEKMLTAIYEGWPGIPDHRFKPYGGRRFQHLLRLCMVESAAAKRLVIQPIDVIRANTWLTYTENRMPRALGEYGTGKNAMGANALMNLFYSKPTTQYKIEQLWQSTSSAFDTQQGFTVALAGLISAKKIQQVGGHLCLAQKPLPKGEFVNYELFTPAFLASTTN